MRADSGFYAHEVVGVCRKTDVRFSITLRQHRSVRRLIEAIPEDAWMPIPYWIPGGADVAEIAYTPFAGKKDAQPVRLIVRRVKPTPGSQLAASVDRAKIATVSGLTVVRGGRVVDPAMGIDEALDVVLQHDRIVALDAPGSTRADTVVDATGCLVTPGLIDLHGHWFIGSPYGLEPQLCIRGAVTTAVDAGSTGYVNFEAFRRLALDRARPRVLAFVHVAAVGLATTVAGELEDLRYARPRETAAVIAANRDVAVGVKVRIGHAACGSNLDAALDAALEAAELARAPLMVDIHGGADVAAIVGRLRAGDILTHCFIGSSPSILDQGAVLPEVLAARARGVNFDVGHGCGSFSWDVARFAIAAGFLPDTISTDLHRYSIERPAVDLPTTMAKFLHLGLSLSAVVGMVTADAARVLRRDDLGTLKPGSRADVAVVRLDEGARVDLVDALGRREIGTTRLTPVAVVTGGRSIHPSAVPRRLRALVDADRLADCAPTPKSSPGVAPSGRMPRD
jgi:dihydroorotase